MKRYLVTSKLKRCIKNSGYSLRKISKMCGFKVRNIYAVNKSINENHLKKLED